MLLSPYTHDKMDVLFVGINPSKDSWKNGHYFSTKPSCSKNSLWRQLREAGFADRLYCKLEADEAIFGNPENRLGITDLVAGKPTDSARKLVAEDYKEGRTLLTKVIQDRKPKWVCFLGKKAYGKFVNVRGSLKYEVHPNINNSKVFVAAFPSSSDQKFERKVDLLKKLNALRKL